jgi:hypothetical protein
MVLGLHRPCGETSAAGDRVLPPNRLPVFNPNNGDLLLGSPADSHPDLFSLERIKFAARPYLIRLKIDAKCCFF